MYIWELEPGAALTSLHSGRDGLDDVAAGRRLAQFGANRLEAIGRESLWRRGARHFTHFFALILWLAAALALLAEQFDPGQGMRQLGLAVIAVILLNGGCAFWQEHRAERAFEALAALLPRQVKVLRGGTLAVIAAEQLVPGDLLLLEEGDDVPADCRAIEAHTLRVTTAALTGESQPAARIAAAVAAASVIEAKNLLLAGSAVVAGRARALVFATGMRTEFGRIAHLAQRASDTRSPLAREIARLSRLVALLATLLGAVFFVVGRALDLSFWDNLVLAIGIIVANVPEGLLPTVTLALAMATQRMARRRVLVRHLPAVEALGSTTVICTDKTGTLTCNRMTVQSVVTAAGRHAATDFRQRAELAAGYVGLLACAAYCHSLKRARDGDWLGDPMEIALVHFAAQAGCPPAQPALIADIPFDAERRRMSVLAATAAGPTLYCKGAPETVLPLCTQVRTAAGAKPLEEGLRAHFRQAQEAMAGAGLRVLALATAAAPSDLPQEEALVLEGLVALEDPPRPDVAAALARCREAGIRVVMVTGDHPATAMAIAREIGLVQGVAPRLLCGVDIARMTEAALELALGEREIVCARATAADKMRIVQCLQRRGEVVAVTGDGVNDAPALKTADVGIAMGRSGTDVAKAAADIVLLDDDFASIVAAIEEGRAVYANIRKFLTYILSSNIPELVPYLAFVLLRVPLPLTVIQILAVDLGTDILPALALGAERPDPELMQRQPRARGERLLSWSLLCRAYLFLGAIEAAVSLMIYFAVLRAGGWTWGMPLAPAAPLYREATTACLAAIVLLQAANLWVCRHPREPFWRLAPRGNRLLLAGMCAELALIAAIVYWPPLQTAFGTAALPAWVWLAALPGPLVLLLLEESRKAWMRASRSTESSSRPPS